MQLVSRGHKEDKENEVGEDEDEYTKVRRRSLSKGRNVRGAA
jgi:hypothetical protein